MCCWRFNWIGYNSINSNKLISFKYFIYKLKKNYQFNWNFSYLRYEKPDFQFIFRKKNYLKNHLIRKNIIRYKYNIIIIKKINNFPFSKLIKL